MKKERKPTSILQLIFWGAVMILFLMCAIQDAWINKNAAFTALHIGIVIIAQNAFIHNLTKKN